MARQIKKRPTQIQVDRELCNRSFYQFVQIFISVVIKEEVIFNWHIKYLCDVLQEIVFRIRDRQPKLFDLIINIPPGTSKSTIITQMLPVWAWVVDPSMRSMTASYSSTLSIDHSVKSRDIIRDEYFQTLYPNIRIKSDEDTKSKYKNTLGGERIATSVTGSATGFHSHLLIVDDPLNPKEASSEADRNTANNFMSSTLPTRKVDKSISVTILVMQRLHKDDPTGIWLEKKQENLMHICLPGMVSRDINPPELEFEYEDGLLDPVRLTKENLTGLRQDLGSYGFAGQIMQVPAPESGGIWQKWLIPVPDDQFPLVLSQHGTDWDLAYTEKEANSASAYCTSGKVGNKMYIDDIGFRWLEFPDLINWMRTKRFPHHIEAKASGKSAKQTLTKNGIPAIEVQVSGGDKPARTRMATPFAESGMVYCRQSLLDKIYNDSKQGILLFPNNSNDDLNDAIVQAIIRLLGKPSFFVV